jgi:hypothetical protein
MTTTSCILLGALLTGMAVAPASAGNLTRIVWTSNNGSFINDTIVNGTTAPLAFTTAQDTAQPFLNAADSTISLGYGTYYAIAFVGYGEHFGAGTVSFELDKVTYSQNVTFPLCIFPSPVFANFTLPGGDRVTIEAAGLWADRIQIAADGAGLSPGGNTDAFYLFKYIQAEAAPKLVIVADTPGYAKLFWTPATAGFVLQENLSLAADSWTYSSSGATNPVILPANRLRQFFRLIKP